MAEDEGFEPPQTESESGVLPLHKSSMQLLDYYIRFFGNVKNYFSIFGKIRVGGPTRKKLSWPQSAGLRGCRWRRRGTGNG